jgi:peroxiredoxin
MKLVISILALSFSFASFGETLTEQLKKRREASAKRVPPEVKKIMNKGVNDLRSLGKHEVALGVGKRIPTISFRDLSKKRVGIDRLYSDQVVVLTFYRGGWCPYCMLELEAYQKHLDAFKKAGAIVVAVSPDSAGEAKKTVKKRKLTFDVFTDPENRAAKLLGLSFKVDKGTLEVYKKFGIDLKKSQGNENNELPMPGTFVIDKKGIVRYSYVDPDYTKRADPLDVLKVVKSL